METQNTISINSITELDVYNRQVKYIIALLPYNHLWGSYRHSHIELFGFFDAEYNKIPTIPLVDEWEICGIKEHGGLNAWEWVRANLVIRNLPLFTEKEIEIPNNNNGVTDRCV